MGEKKVTEEENKQKGTNTESEGTPDDTNEEGKQSAQGAEDKTQDTDPDGSDTWSDDVKDYVKKLRQENAKWRKQTRDLETNFKNVNERLGKFETGLKKLVGGEEDDSKLTPEEKIDRLQVSQQSLELELAVRDLAIERGIGVKGYDYFSFLLNKEFNSLGENEEITEERLDEITTQALAVQGGQQTKQTSTSVAGNGPNPDATKAVTVDQFVAMTTTEKSELYQKNKPMYDSLFAQVKQKKILPMNFY